jgi:hypothetical protein
VLKDEGGGVLLFTGRKSTGAKEFAREPEDKLFSPRSFRPLRHDSSRSPIQSQNDVSVEKTVLLH